jgi:hypothetical protein
VAPFLALGISSGVIDVPASRVRAGPFGVMTPVHGHGHGHGHGHTPTTTPLPRHLLARQRPAFLRRPQVGVLNWFARLWEIDEEEYWGYITNCGTEGNLHGILVGRENLPDGIL